MSDMKENLSEELEEKFQELFRMMDLFDEQDEIRKQYGRYITPDNTQFELLDVVGYDDAEYAVLRHSEEDNIFIYEIIDTHEKIKNHLSGQTKKRAV